MRSNPLFTLGGKLQGGGGVDNTIMWNGNIFFPSSVQNKIENIGYMIVAI